MFTTAILRLSAGPINKINDAAIGQAAAQGFGPTTSKFAGQLGNGIWLDDNNLIYDSAMGTVYGGHFRYVRLAAASTAVVVGQIVFWDNSVASNLFQVTTSEAVSATIGASFRAGIVLNSGWTAGNYGIIQDVGLVKVKFRAVLTDAGVVGSPVFCAASGAGADNGFADVINNVNPATMGDLALLQSRYLGEADEAPTNGGLKRVYINFHNTRG